MSLPNAIWRSLKLYNVALKFVNRFGPVRRLSLCEIIFTVAAAYHTIHILLDYFRLSTVKIGKFEVLIEEFTFWNSVSSTRYRVISLSYPMLQHNPCRNVGNAFHESTRLLNANAFQCDKILNKLFKLIIRHLVGTNRRFTKWVWFIDTFMNCSIAPSIVDCALSSW